MSQENQEVATNPTPPATPAPTPLEQLKAEYELESSAYDPEIDSPIPIQTKAQPKPDVKPEPKAEPVKPGKKHIAALSDMAKDFGMSDEEIEAMDPESLAISVKNMNKMAKLVGQQKTERTLPTEEPAEDEIKLDFGKDEDGPIEEKDINPGIVNLFKSQAKKIADLEKLVNGMAGHLRGQVARTNDQKMDAIFTKSPKLFGTTAREQTDPNSPEYSRRMFALSEAARIAGKNATVQQILAALPKVVENISGIAPEEPSPKSNGHSRIPEDKWKEGVLAAPTQRESHEPKGTPRAIKAVAKRSREMGLDWEGDFEGPEEAGLPE